MSRPIAAVLKDNAVLIAGIALPVLLVLLFACARMIPEKAVADPQYRALFLAKSWSTPGSFEFKVDEDGKLMVTYTKPKDTVPPQTGVIVEPNKILIFNGATGALDTVNIATPDLTGDQTSVTVPVKELTDKKISKDPVAPDGYSFRAESYRSSSLITDIFSYRSHQIPNSIVKDGRVIPLGKQGDTYYHQSYLEFIGWELK